MCDFDLGRPGLSSYPGVPNPLALDWYWALRALLRNGLHRRK